MDDELLEESWLFDDGALDSVGGLGGHDGLTDHRLSLSLLPSLPCDALYEGLEDAGPGAASAPRSAAAGRRGGEGRGVVEDTTRAALLRDLDDGGGWRCLNRGHPEDCTRCLPAPGPAAGADWVLVGDKCVKSGEKKLRSLLSRTPEWGSESIRGEAASEAEAAGDTVMATLLRSRDASALRKLHFLALCRRWRYRADAWVPREVARKRTRDTSPQQRRAPPAARAASQQQALAVSSWAPQQQALPRPQPLPDSATDALRCALQRQLQQYIIATDDTRVHAAAQREPRAPLVTWTVPMLDSLLSVIRGFAAVTTPDAVALSSRCRELSAASASADADALRWTPWWLSDDHELLLRTDSHFALLHKFMQAYFAGLRSLRRAGAPALSATDAAIAEGWVGSVSALDALASIGQSALAHARLSLPTPSYLRVAAEAMAALAAAAQHMVQLHEARRAWCVAREAGSAAKGAHVGGAFWPTVANAARESVIPSAGYAQPRLTYALEAFAVTVTPASATEPLNVFSPMHLGISFGAAMCVAPPSDDELELYCLVGDVGAKNGEKKLRTQITSRPEWLDPEQRDALAAACEAQPEAAPAGLAEALRCRNVSALRKRHLVYLARAYGLKSDIWQRKASGGLLAAPLEGCGDEEAWGVGGAAGASAGAAKRQRRFDGDGGDGTGDGGGAARATRAARAPPASRGAGAGAAPRGAGPLCACDPLALDLSPAAVLVYVERTLRPLSRSACHTLAGHGAAAAAAAHGAPHITRAGIGLSTRAAGVCAALASAFVTDRRSLTAALEAVRGQPGNVAARLPAWRQLLGSPSPAQKVVATLAQVVSVGLATNETDKATLLRLHGPGSLGPADVVWFEEIERAMLDALELSARLDCLLAQLRFADFFTCLELSTAVVDIAIEFAAGAGAAHSTRAAWMAGVVESRRAAAAAAGAAEVADAAEAAAAAASAAAYGARSFTTLLAEAMPHQAALLTSQLPAAQQQ